MLRPQRLSPSGEQHVPGLRAPAHHARLRENVIESVLSRPQSSLGLALHRAIGTRVLTVGADRRRTTLQSIGALMLAPLTPFSECGQGHAQPANH